MKDIWSKISTAGDVAFAALGYVAGFIADTYYFQGGLPPGTVAGVTSVGSIGVKKTIDALISAFKRGDEFEDTPEELERRADALLRYIEVLMDREGSDRSQHVLYKVHRQLAEDLFTFRTGIVNSSEFADSLQDAVASCRGHLKVGAREKSYLKT